MKAMKNATGKQRAELIAEVVKMEGEFRFNMEKIKIAGNKTWDEMTEVQKNKLEQMRRQLDKDVKAMAERMADIGGAFGGPGAGGLINGARGGPGGRRGGGGFAFGGNPFAGFMAGGAAGGGGFQGLGGLMQGFANPAAFARGFLNQAAAGIGQAMAGGVAFANFVQGIEDPVRQMELVIQKTRAELSMMNHNFEKFTLRSGRTNAIMRGRNELEAKRAQLERQNAELERRKEEQEQKRLAAFRRLAATRAEAERRRSEDVALFGPDVDINTGDNRPVDLGFSATSGFSGGGAGGNVSNSNTVNIQMSFTEEVTPDRADQLLDAIDDAAGRRGFDTTGQSQLRGQRPEQAFQGRFARTGR